MDLGVLADVYSGHCTETVYDILYRRTKIPAELLRIEEPRVQFWATAMPNAATLASVLLGVVTKEPLFFLAAIDSERYRTEANASRDIVVRRRVLTGQNMA